jgi:Nicastrin small lobe
MTFHRDYERHILQFPCTRLFTSTGSLGCRNPDSTASIGALIDVSRHLDEINNELNFDFVGVLSGEFFNDTVLATLSDTGRLKGLIVYDLAEDGTAYMYRKDARFSTDVSTPQGDGTAGGSFTLDPNYRWNEAGNALAYSLKNYPIVRAESQEVATLLKLCQENHDNEYAKSKVANTI